MKSDLFRVARNSRDLTLFALVEGFALFWSMQRNVSFKPTGTTFLSNFHDSYPSLHLDVFLHILFAFLIFLIFKKTLGRKSALFSVFAFGASSEHHLVFKSSPFWDYVNYLPLLFAVYLMIEFLDKNSRIQRLTSPKIGDRLLKINLGVISLIFVNEFCNRYESLISANLSIELFYFLAICVLYLPISIVYKNLVKLFGDLTAGESAFLQIFLFNLISSALYVRLTTSLIGIFVNSLVSLIWLIEHFSLRKKWLLTLTITLVNFSLLFGLNFFSASGVGFGFYLLSGMSNPANISNLFSYNQIDSLIHFWDRELVNHLSFSQSNTLGLFFEYSRIFPNILVSHFLELSNYVTWSNGMGDPPTFLNRYLLPLWLFWSGNFITQLFSNLLWLIIPTLVIFRYGKKSFFVFLPITLLFTSGVLTRVQLHQWWIFDTLGLWAILMVSSRIFRLNQLEFRRHIKSIVVAYNAFTQNVRLVRSKFLLISLFAVILVSNSGEFTSTSYRKLVSQYQGVPWKPLTVNFIEPFYESKLQNKVVNFQTFRAIRIRIVSGIKCQNFSFTLYESPVNTPYRTILTSGQSNEGGIFYIPLSPGRFSLTFSGENLKLCSPEIGTANETLFSFPRVAVFDGAVQPRQHNLEIIKNLEDQSIKTELPKIFRSVPINFSARAVNTPYLAYGTEYLAEHLVNNYSARFLGYSGEGYQLKDIKVLNYTTPELTKSLVMTGLIEKGTLGILSSVTLTDNLYRAKPVAINFVESRLGPPNHFDFCVPQEGGGENSLVIFQFQDQYGYGWTKYSKLNFTMNQKSCAELGFKLNSGIRANF